MYRGTSLIINCPPPYQITMDMGGRIRSLEEQRAAVKSDNASRAAALAQDTPHHYQV